MFLMKMRLQLLLTKFLTYAYFFFFYYMVTSNTSISPDKNSQKLLLR